MSFSLSTSTSVFNDNGNVATILLPLRRNGHISRNNFYCWLGSLIDNNSFSWLSRLFINNNSILLLLFFRELVNRCNNLLLLLILLLLVLLLLILLLLILLLLVLLLLVLLLLATLGLETWKEFLVKL